MKNLAHFGFTLAFICVVSAALLAGVNSLTKSRIIAQAKAEEETSLKEVLPKAKNFTAVKKGNEVIYYQGMDGNNKLVGVAFKADAEGYSSAIETMVGMLTDGTITAIKVLAQNETPGLGTRVTEPEFRKQFEKRNIAEFSEVKAITGATISSSAVIDAVRRKAEKVKTLLKDGK